MAINLEILDASQSQLTQNEQVKNMIVKGCDVVCVNLVDRTDEGIEAVKNEEMLGTVYNDKEMEPQTLEVDSDNFQIPLIIGKLRDTWAYGKEARRLATLKEGFTVARLLSRSLANEKIEFGDETYRRV